MKLPINYDDTHWTIRKRVREQYVENQNGKCWFCGNNLDDAPTEEIEEAYINRRLFPLHFFDTPIHLHHNHDTGMTIGAIHCRCNAYLWQYKGE